MKASGDLVIGGSGDRKEELTAETRRRGENLQRPTTEAHGEESGDREIARDRVIGEAAYDGHNAESGHTAYICHPERLKVEQSETSGSRRTPAKTVPEYAASGSSHKTPKNVLVAGLYQGPDFSSVVKDKNAWVLAPAVFKRIIFIMRAVLREIFDESAYDRFLMRTHEPRSVASYRAFTRERDSSLLKKPRCC